MGEENVNRSRYMLSVVVCKWKDEFFVENIVIPQQRVIKYTTMRDRIGNCFPLTTVDFHSTTASR